MKRRFSLLMLLGALLGLLGQEVAFAHVMPVDGAVQLVAAAQMSPECAEMMGLAKQKPQSGKPCEGMTPDCIAKMGCAVPLALLPPIASDAAREYRAEIPRLTLAAPLIGRNVGPEPEPPARLG
ncbi:MULTISPECIES: hypothetical protein [Sphingobium]|nr:MULTISPECIES: hypothetical protein [Sphingobium]